MADAIIIHNTINSIQTTGLQLLLSNTLDYNNIHQIKYRNFDEKLASLKIEFSTTIYILCAEYVTELISKIRSVANARIVVILSSNHYMQYNLNDLVSIQNIGIVNIDAPTTAISECIHTLEQKGYYMCPMTKDFLINNLIDTNDKYANYGFNKLERQILDLSRQGYNIQLTAQRLNLSKNTVAAYRSRMIKKAGLRSFTELVFLHKD